jgi:hypothetical protein
MSHILYLALLYMAVNFECASVYGFFLVETVKIFVLISSIGGIVSGVLLTPETKIKSVFW